MVRRFYRPAPGAERTAEQKTRGAAREIRYQSEQEGRTHYLIIPPPENVEARMALENVLRQIRARYPGLICLTLNHDDEIEDDEHSCFRLLLGMLPKIPENLA